MANTFVPATPTPVVNGQKEVVVYLTVQFDGSGDETATVIYDSSAIASTLGITDPAQCRILWFYGSASMASTARVRLLYDATTPRVALDIPAQVNAFSHDFRPVGGLVNSTTTGRTGDITLTTTGSASGDTLTIAMIVRVA